MIMTDNISDMLTRIRNAYAVGLLSVMVPLSKFKVAILRVLKEEGYIQSYIVDSKYNAIDVSLKYSSNGVPAILEIYKISKSGKRVYSSIKDLNVYYSGMGISVLSTSKGVMSDRTARQKNVGGEVMIKVF